MQMGVYNFVGFFYRFRFIISCCPDDMEKEQNKRHERATEDYQKQQEQFNRDLEFNKKHQDELKAELQKLKVKEEGMKENKIFQTEVQKRAEKVIQGVACCYKYFFYQHAKI